MLRQIITRLRSKSKKVNNRLTARAVFRRTLFIESLEGRRMLSHFRAGTLSSEPTPNPSDSVNAVHFNFQQAWRLNSLSGTNTVGNVVSNFDTLNFGDSSTAPIVLKILSVNVVENWLLAEAGTGTVNVPGSFVAGFDHTYANSGPFTASMSSCCRIGGLQNNSGGNYRNETLVSPGTLNSSPVSSLPPIVQVADNTIASFQIPGFDPNNDAITYRLSTSAEAGSPFVQPTGLTVNSSGLVMWNILNSGGTSTNIGDLWSVQVMLEDHSGNASGPVKSKTPVDFILQVVNNTNQAPVVDATPMGPFSPTAGQLLTFTVTADDPDAAGTITNLQAINPPTGMTLSPFVPGLNTTSRTVSWTPTAAQANQTFVVTFQATDNAGATGITSVTISPAANLSPTANAGGPYNVDEGSSIILLGSGFDPEGSLLTYDWDLDDNGSFETPGQNVTFSAASLDGGFGTHVHAHLRVTDNVGNTGVSEAKISINNVAPANVNLKLSANVIDENGSTSLSIIFTDPGTPDTHTVVVDWGDGSSTNLPLGAGVLSLSGVTHQYLDDGPYPGNGTASDSYKISVTVTDDDGDSGSGSTSITVNNVAPTVTDVAVTSPIFENDTAHLTGAISDPGSKDAFTVVVNWGEGLPVSYTLPAGSTSFDLTHQYLDDGASPGNGTASDTYAVTIVSFTDDDGGSAFGGGGGGGGGIPIATSFSVTPTNDANTLANSIAGSGITITSATYAGAAVASGTFVGGLSTGIGIESGIILTSGFANNAMPPNDSDSATGVNFTPGDADLATLIPGFTTFDAASLVLTFNSAGGDVFFSYVFASEEYNEFADSPYNDVFGFFLDGTNIALIPGTSTAVSINNVNASADDYPEFFNSNDPSNGIPTPYAIEYDGFTDVFTAKFLGLSAGSHTLKLAIADAGDSSYDSAVFIQAGSLSDLPPGLNVVVKNVEPVVNPLLLSATTIDENGSVTVTGSYTDVGTLDTHTVMIDWGVGQTASAATVNPLTRTFTATHQYLDDGLSPGNGTLSDIYTINATVTDDDTLSGTASATLTVDNVAPKITSLDNSSSDCGDASEGEVVTISGMFADVGTLDKHTVTINWGDTTSSAGAVTESGGSGSISGSHIYTAGGIYTITVTLTDDDTGATTKTTTTVITGVGVVGNTLYVIGTDIDDHVTINKAGSVYRVHADFLTTGNFRDVPLAGITLINVILCDGDDEATISANVITTAILDGGADDDHLNGGGGSNILLGGSGDDMLIGGSARDILIGGTGRDRLVGNGGQDILIGDATIYDLAYISNVSGNNEALLKILKEWNEPTRNLLTRRANIAGTGTGTRLNDNFFFKLGTGATIVADLADDVLTGSSGEDWFWLLGSDVATDLKPNQGDLLN